MKKNTCEICGLVENSCRLRWCNDRQIMACGDCNKIDVLDCYFGINDYNDKLDVVLAAEMMAYLKNRKKIKMQSFKFHKVNKGGKKR